jgi:hypothetical protein
MTIPQFDGFEPKLEHLFDMHADLEPPQLIGEAPAGTRQIYIVKSGYLDGPRLRGELLPGGGDWATIRPDGTVQLDVRATLKTYDGALVYAYYSGYIVDVMKAAGRVFAGEDVALGDYSFYTNPMFQTGAERYEWLNRIVAIGRGRIVAGGVEYRVWALTNPS